MDQKKKKVEIIPKFVGVQGPYFDFGIADPLGSYTGVPIPEAEIPVQDADDL